MIEIRSEFDGNDLEWVVEVYQDGSKKLENRGKTFQETITEVIEKL